MRISVLKSFDWDVFPLGILKDTHSKLIHVRSYYKFGPKVTCEFVYTGRCVFHTDASMRGCRENDVSKRHMNKIMHCRCVNQILVCECIFRSFWKALLRKLTNIDD